MRKITFLIAFLLSSMLSGHAQLVQAYTRTAITGQTFTPITGGTVINTNAGLAQTVMSTNQDDGAVLVTLPFTFTYGGSTFTQVTFCTNGWVGMGDQTAVSAANSRTPGNLWTTTAPNNTLAAWFGDIGANFPIGSGSMVHGSIGTDVYAFEWRNAVANGFTQSAQTINFMVVIYGPASATPGRIEFLYGGTNGNVTVGRAIGIENATGGPGNFINAVNGSNTLTTLASAWPGNGNGYRFDPNSAACATPVGGTIVGGANQYACASTTPATITVTGATAPLTGVTYAWQQSTDGGTSWVAAVGGSGAATTSYTPPSFTAGSIRYRLKVTCGGVDAFSEVAILAGPGTPAIQATNLTAVGSTTNVVLNWAIGTGSRRVVIVSDTPIVDPVDGTGPALTVSTVYAGGQQIIYDGTGSTVTMTGVPCTGGTYYYKVYEVIRCGSAAPYTYYYNTTTGSNTATVTVQPATAAPTIQAANISFVDSPGQVVVNWANGNGARRFVVVSDTPITDPASAQTGAAAITGAAAYAGGQQVVYEGTGSSVTVTGIPCSGGTYYVKVYEYDRCGTAGDYTHGINVTSGTNTATHVVNALAAPTTQASALTLTPSAGQIVANWTNGNGSRRMVLIDTQPIPDLMDENGVVGPTADASWNDEGIQVAYDGTAATVTITGLSCTNGDVYYVKVIEYNRCGATGSFDYIYNNSVGTNVATHNITAPGTQASALAITSTYNSAAISWTSGNGTGRIVVVSDAAIVDPIDESGVAAPTAAAVYQGGQQIVYVGTGSTITVTGLSCNSTYFVKVYEYFRCGATPNFSYTYNITTGTNAGTINTTLPTVALPQATSFTGFTGANLAATSTNWMEARIPTTAGDTPTNSNPQGVTSDWLSSTALGTTTARVNLSSRTKNEWIISPKTTITGPSRLKFKAAITAAASGAAASASNQMTATQDDAVSVLISTDGCGATWTPIHVFSAATVEGLTNSLTDFSFVLDPSYVGQTVQIAFQATDGPVDDGTITYDFHIGNIVLELVPSCDTPSVITDPVLTVTENGGEVVWGVPATTTPSGYQYVFSPDNTAPTTAGTDTTATTASTNILASSTQYYTWVRTVCGTEFSNWVMVASFRTLCDAPEVLTTTPATRCGTGTVELAATTVSGATLSWYAAETGGAPLATGPTFTTPSINANTTYYVGASTSGSSISSAGMPAPTGTSTFETTGWGIVFDVAQNVTINTVDIYSATAGTVNIAITTAAGVELFSTGNMPIVAGATVPNAVPINYTIAPGTGYKMIMKAYSGVTLVRELSGATFPHNGTDGNLNVVGSWTTSVGFTTYYWFYNVRYTAGCQSLRTPVLATVTEAEEITAAASNTTICAGQSTNLTVESDNEGYSYVWMPGNLTGPAHTVTPTATTTYTVTATDEITGCVNIANVIVTVNSLPAAITVTPATAQACPGTTVALTASGNAFNGNAALGTGNVIPATTGVPNPLTGYYGGQWTQMLYKKAELEAQGLNGSSQIYSIAFDLSAAQADAVTNFTIRIGHTTQENMSAGFVPYTGLTTVYYEAVMTPAEGVTGLKVFTFTAPFTWDGTSNLIVEVVHNQGGSGTTSGTVTKATTTPFVSVYYLRKDTVTGGVEGFQTQDYSAVTTKGALSDRPNTVFNFGYALPVTWSPVTGLYTDAAATEAYTGQSAATVYALPTANTTYTATTTNSSNCIATDDAAITVGSANTPTGATSQTISANSPEEATIEDIVVTETGVIWYASEANAIAGVNPLPAGTQVMAGSVYYGTLSTGSCVPLAVTVTEVLGSKGFDRSQFTYYPNPVKDVLNLKYSNEISGVEVYNLLGQKIITKDVNATETIVDMSGIAEGNYIVKVKSGDSVETIKIVKKQ